MRSGKQSNIAATSESSQGRQEKPQGAAEFGDLVSGLGTGSGSGSPLPPPRCPQGATLVLRAPGAAAPQWLRLEGTRGGVGDPEGVN